MKLNSHKTRHGHLVVKSTERNKQVKIDGVNDDGLKEFNDLLNQEPFATDGFPLYSKRFLDPKWKAIQDKLLDKAQGFGKLAMDETGTHRTRFTGVEECSDLEKSCDEWAKCRGVNIPKSEVKPEDIIPSKCNFTKGFREIIMDNVHNTIKLKEGEKVRIVPKVFNGTDYVRWTVDEKENVDGEDIVKKKQAKPLNESRSCDAQENFFIDSNGRDLIILEVTREMATGTIEAKTAFASAKIHVEVEKREDKSFPYKYVIIGVIIALVVIAIILLGLCCWCKCCRNRKSEESTKHSTTRGKSSKKKSSKKSGDDSNSNKEGELLSKEQSQNPVGSARPAYRVDKKKPKEPEKKKEVKVNLSPLDQDFFATPVEREVAETNIPIPVKAGAKDPFLICTDQENTGASPTPQPSDPKTERLSGEIANKVFGFATPAAEGAAAPSPAKNSLEAAAAAGTPAVPAAAAAIA
ncbi:hypothetical protein PFISCL1PPCAC_1700, partial [Pristionchus fissidentatus]